MTTPTYIIEGKGRKGERATTRGRRAKSAYFYMCVYQEGWRVRESVCGFGRFVEMFSSYFLPCLLRAHDFFREMLLCDREEGVNE